jgi:hypothetical protein
MQHSSRIVRVIFDPLSGERVTFILKSNTTWGAMSTFSLVFAEDSKLPLNPFNINDTLIGKPAPELQVSEWINGEGITFEGHDYQSPERLKTFLVEKGIDHLIGVDAYKESERVPITTRRYRTGGTPSMVIVDKDGIIRFKCLGGFNREPVKKLIDALLLDYLRGKTCRISMGKQFH